MVHPRGEGVGVRELGRGRGRSASGLRDAIEKPIRRHVDPEPELALGLALAHIDEVTSCIDVSDGLSTDLHHLCDASNCGAEIEKERIPVFPDLQAFAGKLGINVRDVVLHGGEEYALLFTSSLRESELSARLGRPVYAIGRMTKERGVLLKEDGVARLKRHPEKVAEALECRVNHLLAQSNQRARRSAGKVTFASKSGALGGPIR